MDIIPVPEENDSIPIIIIKMVLVALTIVVIGFGTLSQGIRILQLKNKPKMGFHK